MSDEQQPPVVYTGCDGRLDTTGPNFLRLVDSIGSRLSYKFRFAYHEAEDIKQDIAAIILEKKDAYSPGRGKVEAFFYTVCHNKLFNNKRNNFHRPGSSSEAKRNVIMPLPLDGISDEREPRMHTPPTSDPATAQLLMGLGDKILREIDLHLPVERREDFVRLLNGEKLSRNRHESLVQEIRELLKDRGYDMDDNENEECLDDE